MTKVYAVIKKKKGKILSVHISPEVANAEASILNELTENPRHAVRSLEKIEIEMQDYRDGVHISIDKRDDWIQTSLQQVRADPDKYIEPGGFSYFLSGQNAVIVLRDLTGTITVIDTVVRRVGELDETKVLRKKDQKPRRKK